MSLSATVDFSLSPDPGSCTVSYTDPEGRPAQYHYPGSPEIAPVRPLWGVDAETANGSGHDMAYPTFDLTLAPLVAFEAEAKRHMDITMIGAHWDNDAGVPTAKGIVDPAGLAAILAHGTIPLVQWQSYDSRYAQSSASQIPFSIPNILGGSQDAYIDAIAAVCKSYGGPMYMRFDHEFNGDFNLLWSPGITDANSHLITPTDYRNLWQYVRARFNALNVTNVIWVWCPMTFNAKGIVNSRLWSDTYTTFWDPTLPGNDCYPGNQYVDRVALDGYNWTPGWSTWAQIFTAAYNAITAAYPNKPLMIVENGCEATSQYTTPPTTRAGWYADAYGPNGLGLMPAIVAVLYFNWDAWRIDNDSGSPDPTSEAAYALALAAGDGRYSVTFPGQYFGIHYFTVTADHNATQTLSFEAGAAFNQIDSAVRDMALDMPAYIG